MLKKGAIWLSYVFLFSCSLWGDDIAKQRRILEEWRRRQEQKMMALASKLSLKQKKELAKEIVSIMETGLQYSLPFTWFDLRDKLELLKFALKDRKEEYEAILSDPDLDSLTKCIVNMLYKYGKYEKEYNYRRVFGSYRVIPCPRYYGAITYRSGGRPLIVAKKHLKEEYFPLWAWVFLMGFWAGDPCCYLGSMYAIVEIGTRECFDFLAALYTLVPISIRARPRIVSALASACNDDNHLFVIDKIYECWEAAKRRAGTLIKPFNVPVPKDFPKLVILEAGYEFQSKKIHYLEEALARAPSGSAKQEFLEEVIKAAIDPDVDKKYWWGELRVRIEPVYGWCCKKVVEDSHEWENKGCPQWEVWKRYIFDKYKKYQGKEIELGKARDRLRRYIWRFFPKKALERK